LRRLGFTGQVVLLAIRGHHRDGNPHVDAEDVLAAAGR